MNNGRYEIIGQNAALDSYAPKVMRTAAYCRVSTELEEQEGSYEMQMTYFKNKIESDPYMVLAGLYGDHGKSGLKTKGREGLNRLMADCEAGKIDLILTKSVSRFARNMADCLELINRLRELKVTVVFEKENLRTSDLKSELILNILAALAQEESNSISQNVRRGYEQHVLEGRPYSKPPYGFRRLKDGTWVVHRNEAKRVRMAFHMAAEGRKYPEILDALNQLEYVERTGKTWKNTPLRNMLQSVNYIGDFHSHKNVCLTPGHSVENRGYRDRYYIEDHHEAIVSKAVFERVQKMIELGLLSSFTKLTTERQRMLEDDSWKAMA